VTQGWLDEAFIDADAAFFAEDETSVGPNFARVCADAGFVEADLSSAGLDGRFVGVDGASVGVEETDFGPALRHFDGLTAAQHPPRSPRSRRSLTVRPQRSPETAVSSASRRVWPQARLRCRRHAASLHHDP
jgi:hypothetical protein